MRTSAHGVKCKTCFQITDIKHISHYRSVIVD
jgi:hypothetical protein